jgi:hypothetical protein
MEDGVRPVIGYLEVNDSSSTRLWSERIRLVTFTKGGETLRLLQCNHLASCHTISDRLVTPLEFSCVDYQHVMREEMYSPPFRISPERKIWESTEVPSPYFLLGPVTPWVTHGISLSPGKHHIPRHDHGRCHGGRPRGDRRDHHSVPRTHFGQRVPGKLQLIP